jgi:NodT family efflux transporter outer membrane factor (OMF) lipoprotein
LRSFTVIQGTIAALLSVVLSGCSNPLHHSEPEPIQMPSAEWFDQQHAVTPVSDWWRQLGSEELNQLLAQAMRDNPDVQIALQRLQVTEALLQQNRSANWPSLAARAGASQSQDLEGNDSGFSNSSSLSFSASYEVDLWARRATDIDNAQLDVEAQQWQNRSAEITLTGQLVQHYVKLLALQERLRLARKNLAASKNLQRIVQIKFGAGAVSGIEVAQQKNTTLGLKSRVAGLEYELAVQKRVLAALSGRTDLNLPAQEMTLDQLSLPAVADIQPAALLSQRPDIQLANIELWQRHADIWLAESKRWPTLNLSAGLSASDVLNPTGWVLSVGESLTMPLFDGGSISAQIQQAEAGERIAKIQYRQTIMTAMQETLDALDELSYQHQELEIAKAELENNQRLLSLAEVRFDSGDTDFSDLLNAQRSLFSAEDSLVVIRQNHLNALVSLYLVLGDIPAVGLIPRPVL